MANTNSPRITPVNYYTYVVFNYPAPTGLPAARALEDSLSHAQLTRLDKRLQQAWIDAGTLLGIKLDGSAGNDEAPVATL
jgi:uncharacterized protein YbaP (TraB family)